MKITPLISALMAVSSFLSAQSLSPVVVSSSGDHFQATNGSVSWTLGELVTETYASTNIVLTQGFQQPYQMVIHGVDLDLFVYLEGPYSSGIMATDLRDEGLLPLIQPYGGDPWYYPGGESVTAIPPDVVDWVLVELRDATSASGALPSTAVERNAGFILADGSVVGLDGGSPLMFTSTLIHDPYIALWHRNHLGILSSGPAMLSGDVYTYDFSTSIDKAHGGSLGYILLEPGSYGMVSGDANRDGNVNMDDKTDWNNQAGTRGYHSSDLNLNAQVENSDKNDHLLKNTGKTSQIPE